MLLTADQQSAIGHEQDDNFECFFRLLKDGEMFNCTRHLV